MKKIYKLSIILLALILSTSLIAQTYSGGAGTSGDPYLISNTADLKYLSENTGEWSNHYKQTADITFVSADFEIGGAFYNDGKGFMPMGHYPSVYFTGSYNGQEHTIDGLYINRPAKTYVGFFGYTNGSTISNLGIINADITGDESVGALAGELSGSTATNCYATGSIVGGRFVGGLIGGNLFSSTINESYATCTVSGVEYCGGLTGRNYQSIVNNSYASGSVSGTSNSIGGLSGGNINSSTINKCYSTGTASGTTSVGGLLGENSSSSVNNSFWDTETSGLSSSAGGTGKTTAKMKTQSTFTDAGWDFTNDWNIGNSYPYLEWQTLSDITWDGSTNTDWHTDSNWDLGFAPTADHSVIIPNVTNDPIITESADCNNLTVNSGGSLTIASTNTETGSLITYGNITNNGTINTQRYVSQDVWHLISSPITNATTAIFTGDYIQTWDETTATWEVVTETTTALTPAQGYGFWSDAKASTYTFSGTPNTGNQSIALSYTAVADSTRDGANLLGNPYPSSIDWEGLRATYGAVNYWNGTQYATWNGSGTGANGGVQYIPPMQGFFIVVNSSGTFSLTNSDRTHSGASAYFKDSKLPSNSFMLKAISEVGIDELFIRFDENTSQDFELEHDAYKFLSNTEGLSEIFSFSDVDKLAIDVRPATDIVQLGFKNNQNGVYQIGIKEMNGIVETILEDTKTEVFHNLQNGDYEFAWNTSDAETRFILHLKATGINDFATSNTQIFAYQKTIKIRSSERLNNAQVSIIDMMGRVVYEQSLVDGQNESVTVLLEDGVYLVQLVSDSGTQVEKVILK